MNNNAVPTVKPYRRWLWWAIPLALVAVLLITVLGGAWWLQNTESGARWLLGMTEGQGVTTRSVSGSFNQGLKIGNLDYETDGLRLTAGNLGIELDIGLFPIEITVENLSVRQLDLYLEPTAPKDDSGFPDSIASPIPVTVERGLIQTFNIHNGPQTQNINQLAISGTYGDLLVLKTLGAQHSQGDAAVEGRVDLNRPFAHDLTVNLNLAADHPQLPGARLGLHLDGNTDSTELVLNITGPATLRSEGTLTNLLDQPGWNLTATSNALSWPLAANSPDTAPVIQLKNLQAQTEGDIDGYQLMLATRLTSPDQPPADITFSGQGNLNQFQVDALQADILDGQLQASGLLTWQDGLSLNAQGDLLKLTPTPLVADWPTDVPVSGTFDLIYAGEELRLTPLTLNWSNNSRLAANLVLNNALLDGTVSWQHLQWPPNAPDAIRSPEGQLVISGTPQAFQLNGSLGLQAPQSPPGQLRITGNGDQNSLTLTQLDGDLIGGSFTGAGQLAWSPQISWSAELSAEGLQPQQLDQRFPGTVDLQLNTDGTLADETLQATVNIIELQGEIREQLLTGSGSVRMDDGRVTAEGLQIRSGDALLRLNGSPVLGQSLAGELAIPELGLLLPDARGSIDAQLQVAADQRFELSLSGNQLIYTDMSAEDLEVKATGQWPGQVSGWTESGLNLDLTAQTQAMIIGGNRINTADIALNGDATEFSTRLEASNNQAELAASLEAGLQLGDKQPWQLNGRLSEITIDHQRLGGWQQRQAADLLLSDTRVQIDQLCIDQNTGNGNVCIDSQIDQTGQAALTSEFNALPVQLALLTGPSELRLTQQLDGQITWQRDQPESLGIGQADIRISAGSARFADVDVPPLQTGDGSLEAQLNPDGTATGLIDLPLVEGGGIQADISLDAGNWQAGEAIDGRLQAQLNDLGALQSIMPTLDDAAGRLGLDIQLGGQLAEPSVSGALQLEGAGFTYLPLGLKLRDTNLNAEFDASESIRINGSFLAGEGRGDISGRIQLGEQLNGELQISGNQLAIIDSPTIQLTASPDLQMNWADQVLSLDGRIVIPEAEVTPRSEEIEVVTESEDVVLVNAPETDTSEPATAPFQINGGIQVVLGDDVRFDAGDTEATLTGELALQWDSQNLLPDAEGRINLPEGRYQAYGQLLELKDSSLRFGGGPADNPRLRIEAVREIFGNPAVQFAGVRIRGTAQRPDIRLFTDPPSNEETALAYVITGNDFDHGSGVGALSVGTYVLPRLYLSYGFGLFEETGNVVSARYEFTRNWGVRVVSGERDTGADVTYTIDRD